MHIILKSEVKPLKKTYSKTVSSLLAALLTASCFSSYTSAVNLDYHVESGVEHDVVAETISSLSSEVMPPELDFTVETSDDISQVSLYDENTVSLMNEEEYVFFEGSGTETDPYIISTPIELKSMSFWINNGAFYDAYYRLENDIDLGGVEWTPIGEYQKTPNTTYAFQGHFDGNGKTISNFKITKPKLYAGFFGLVENGTIKNLTLSDFKINTEYAGTAMYVGGITGIARASGETEEGSPAVVIENCHVKNAEITAKSNLRVYGSGHIGYLHSSQNASISISGCSTNATCNFSVIDTDSASADRSMIRAGGLIGYVGITDAKISISNSYSGARVTAIFTDAAATERNDIHIGGFVGDFALSSVSEATRSKLDVDSCYSTNMVYATADGDSYAGGFAGYLVSSASDVIISNCHTNSNVYSTSTANTSYIGGFSSILGIAYSDNLGKITLEAVYAAGNVIDINSNDSCGGKITSYIEQDPEFKYCYVMADSVLSSNKNTLYKNNSMTKAKELNDDEIPGTVFDAASASDINNYAGFDIDTWVAGTAPYSYPVLAENTLVHGEYRAYYYNGETAIEYMNGLTYNSVPEKPSYLPESNYIFSHWSLYRGGPDAIDGTATIKSDTIFFPNNSSEYKSYEIKFYANGQVFHTDSIKYNSAVEFPTAPPKPADSLFRYAFSHWAKSENGSEINTSKEIVKGNAEYYAVYQKVETGVWDGISTTAYANGNGSAESPYEISDAYNLAYLSSTVNNGTAQAGAYYILTKDIDLGGYEWTPVGTPENPFNGTFYGNGYSIYNLEITKPETTYAGVFGYVLNSHITQLEVSGFTVDINGSNNTYYAGGIAAYMISDGTETVSEIEQCYTDGEINIVSQNAYSGGIAGYIKDTDSSTAYIRNCYSSIDITLNTSSNSTAGGMVGKFDSQTLGLSYIDNCYYNGNISALSDVSAYGGGIAGFIFNDEDWIDESSGAALLTAVLAEETLPATVRNSFYAGSAITLSLGNTSYGGTIYGYKSDITEISSCGYIESAKVDASKISAHDEIFKISKTSNLYDAEYLNTKFSFDFDNLWDAKDGALPVLKIFNQIKNVFKINEYDLNAENGTIDVELKICNRDVEKYLVLLGAYDVRGKMIGFKSVSITNPAELQTIEINLNSMEAATSCTLTVINPVTLANIEAPVTLTK